MQRLDVEGSVTRPEIASCPNLYLIWPLILGLRTAQESSAGPCGFAA